MYQSEADIFQRERESEEGSVLTFRGLYSQTTEFNRGSQVAMQWGLMVMPRGTKQHSRRALKKHEGFSHSCDRCAWSLESSYAHSRCHHQELFACPVTKPKCRVSLCELWGYEPWDLCERECQTSASYICKGKTVLDEWATGWTESSERLVSVVLDPGQCSICITDQNSWVFDARIIKAIMPSITTQVFIHCPWHEIQSL